MKIGKLIKGGVELLQVAWELLSPAERNAARRRKAIEDAAARRKAELEKQNRRAP